MGRGVWFISAMLMDTETPEYRERPTRSHLTNAKRGNPVEVLSVGSRPQGTPISSAGTGRPEKRRPAAERHREPGSIAIAEPAGYGDTGSERRLTRDG